MKNRRLQNGFSLMEVLIAAVILAAGIVMIAGTFPVAIFLTAASVEQTIAPIVADEAFAKIQLYDIQFGGTYGLSPTINTCDDYNNINTVKTATVNINGNEYLYPSDNSLTDRVYNWSAICRRVNPNLNDRLVQVTVFVSRKTGQSLKYPNPSGGADVDLPTPVKITTGAGTGANQRRVGQSFITDGCTLVADQSGNMYRVLDHANVGGNVEVTLDRNWNVAVDGVNAWIVPPPVSGGRSPVIGVYQRIIRF